MRSSLFASFIIFICSSTSQVAIAEETLENFDRQDIQQLPLLYVEEVRNKLPPDLLMRLPEHLSISTLQDSELGYYTIQVHSFEEPSSIVAGLYHCESGALSCLSGYFSADQLYSEAGQNSLNNSRERGVTVSLSDTIQGYLFENNSSELSSIVWLQDEIVYTISFRTQDQEQLASMARSMANSAPIESQSIAQSIPMPELITTSAGGSSTNLTSEDNTSLISSRISLDNSTSPNATSAEENSSDNSVETIYNLDSPPPLPEELNIDESGGHFPLSVIRPISTLSLSLDASIFTNVTPNVITPTDATAFPINASLRASPELGSRTRLSTGVGGNFTSFTNSDNYSSINADLGILQDLGNQMSLGGGWSYQQVYANGAPSDLSEHAAFLSWNRVDELVARRLFLNSGIGISGNFAQDERQSRLANNIGLGLSYSFTPRISAAIGYNLLLDNFFDNSDADTVLRHQFGAQISHQIDNNFFVGTSVSYLFGRQVNLLDLDSGVDDINNVAFGLHFGFNLPLLD